MKHTFTTGAIVALVAAAVAAFGGAIGLTTAWPVLLAVAIGVASGAPTVGRVAGYAVGAVIGLVTLGARAALFPDVPAARGGAVAVAVVVLAVVAAASRERMALWAGLAGYAAFSALYEPRFADSPTTFLVDAPVSLLVVLIAAGIGVLAVQVPAILTGAVPGRPAPVDEAAVAQGGSL